MKILSLLSSATELVCAIGREHQLIGRSHECDHPQSVLSLPVVSEPRVSMDKHCVAIDRDIKDLLKRGLSIYQVLIGQLESLNPDIVLTQDHCKVCAVSIEDVEAALGQLCSAKPNIISLRPNCLEDIWQDFLKVGRALDAEGRAQKLVTTMQYVFNEISQRVPANLKGRKIACIEWIDPLMAAGNWIPEMVAMLGGDSLFAGPGIHSPMLGWDELEAAQAEVILVMPCGYSIEKTSQEMKTLTAHAQWNNLPAVKNKRVFIGDGNQFFNRPGPRLLESFQAIAEILYPEQFYFGLEGSAWIQHDKSQSKSFPWLEIHRQTCEAKNDTYIDPASGRIAISSYSHLSRGECCGSGCRHCPYGNAPVPTR